MPLGGNNERTSNLLEDDEVIDGKKDLIPDSAYGIPNPDNRGVFVPLSKPTSHAFLFLNTI